MLTENQLQSRRELSKAIYWARRKSRQCVLCGNVLTKEDLEKPHLTRCRRCRYRTKMKLAGLDPGPIVKFANPGGDRIS